MALLISANLLNRQPSFLQYFLELLLSPAFGLRENHLAARQGMNLRVAFDLDGRIEQIRILPDHVGHRAHRHRVRHAGVWGKLANHVRFLVVVGVKRFADQHVALTAAQLEVIEGFGQLAKLFLVGEFVWKTRQRVAETVVGPTIDPLEGSQEGFFHARVFARRMAMFQFADCRMQEIVQPDGNGRSNYFGAFLLEPALDVVVAFALVGLEPEFSGDLHFRFHAKAIDFDAVPHLAHLTQRAREIVSEQVPGQSPVFRAVIGPLAEHSIEIFNACFENFVGLTGMDFIRPGHVLEIAEEVTEENSPDQSEAQRQVNLEPAAVRRPLVKFVLCQKKHAEIAQA